MSALSAARVHLRALGNDNVPTKDKPSGFHLGLLRALVNDLEDANGQRILFACAIAHLLEHADTGEPLDVVAAHTMILNSGLVHWAKANAVLLPARRDGRPQHERFRGAR